MTNAEKYLKDGVDVKQFAEMIDTAYVKADRYADVCESTINWLNKPVKLTLTEDERVILKNIKKKYKYIGKDGATLYVTELPLKNGYDTEENFYLFDHLFQFINNGEEYSIEGLLDE